MGLERWASLSGVRRAMPVARLAAPRDRTACVGRVLAIFEEEFDWEGRESVGLSLCGGNLFVGGGGLWLRHGALLLGDGGGSGWDVEEYFR